MTSRCTVHRSGTKTVDENGWEVSGWSVTYSELPLRIGGGERYRTVTVGQSDVQVAVRIAHLPALTDDLRDGDLIEVTDGENVGMVLRIVEASWQDQATARRVPVVETERPSEWDA